MTATVNGSDRGPRLQSRVPPRSLESEECIIGAILGSPEVLNLIGDTVSWTDFANVDNGRIYGAMCELHNSSRPVHVIGVVEHLKTQFQYGDDHWAGVINQAMDFACPPWRAKDHAETIKLKSLRRKLIYDLTQSVSDAYDETIPLDSIALNVSDSLREAATGTTRRPRLKIRSVGTSAHVAKLHPMLIEGIQRRGEIANIVAPPKVGKTWLSASKSLCLASGRPWLGKFRTARSKVLVVDAELHGPTFDERLPRVAMALGIAPEEWEGRIDVINTRGERMDLMALCAELRNLAPGEYDLCVIDALYRFIPKGFDENSNSDMNTLYNEIDSVAMKLGLAFDVIHHSSKGLQSDKAVTDVGAGAGAQSRAADTHMVLRQHEAEGVYVIDAAVRSWAPLQAFCIRWDYPIWRPADEFDAADLKRPKSKRGDSASRAETGNDGGEDPNVAKVIEAMRLYPDGETARVIRAKTKLSGVKCQPIIDMLVADGMAEETLTKKGRQPVSMYKLIEVGQVGQGGSDPADPGSGSTRSIERVTQTHYPPVGSEVPRLEDVDVFG